ncbi:MAG: hypothetical protein CMJ40_05410 [Phycisphaerae bacterium]|nr:hypothetical protein [Phycisphaerae bacterium]|tara:strand:+ start:2058 stop:2435 length:378 start_codon:yes stop_codon:yes gene_type:complete
MDDKKADRQARKEAIWSHMEALRTIANKRPWYNWGNKGSLISRKGVYLNWWQTGLSLVAIFGGFFWIGSTAIGSMERIANKSVTVIDSLEDNFKELEKKNEALTKELDECKGTKTETSDDKAMTP